MKKHSFFILLMLVSCLLWGQGGWDTELDDNASLPQRIVSVTLMSDEILLDLVDTDRILALTTTSVDPDISNIADEAALVENHLTMNAEAIIALNPDLVLVADWSDASAVSLIEEAGISVEKIATPTNLESVETLVIRLGELTGEEANADAIIDWIDAEKAAVDQALAAYDHEALTILEYTPFGNGGGAGSSWDYLVTEAGLVNAAADYEADQWGYVPLSRELLVTIDPDFLCLPGWVWGDPNGASAFRNEVTEDPALSSLSAIENDRVISIPEKYKSAVSQYMVLGIRALAEAAYPQAF